MDNFPLNLAHCQLRKAEKYEKDGKLETAATCLSEAISYLKNVLSSSGVEGTAKQSIESQILAVEQDIERLNLKQIERERLKEVKPQASYVTGQGIICDYAIKARKLANSIHDTHNGLVEEMKETILQLSACLESMDKSAQSQDQELSESLQKAKDYTSQMENILSKLSSISEDDMLIEHAVVESESRKVTISLEVGSEKSPTFVKKRSSESPSKITSVAGTYTSDFELDMPDILPLEVPTFDFTIFQSSHVKK